MLVKIHTLHIFAGISQWDQYLDEFAFKVFMHVRFHEKISSFLTYTNIKEWKISPKKTYKLIKIK